MKNKSIKLHIIFAVIAILIARFLPVRLFVPLINGADIDSTLAQELAFHICRFAFLLYGFHHIYLACKENSEDK